MEPKLPGPVPLVKAILMQLSNHELEAFLEEALPVELMSEIEQSLRNDAELRERLMALIRQRDQGAHTVGSIWRRHRLSCPTREQLGSFLLDALEDDVRDYIAFHVDVIGCRFCKASLDDLRQRQAESTSQRAQRRRRYFESSAGHFRKS